MFSISFWMLITLFFTPILIQDSWSNSVLFSVFYDSWESSAVLQDLLINTGPVHHLNKYTRTHTFHKTSKAKTPFSLNTYFPTLAFIHDISVDNNHIVFSTVPSESSSFWSICRISNRQMFLHHSRFTLGLQDPQVSEMSLHLFYPPFWGLLSPHSLLFNIAKQFLN